MKADWFDSDIVFINILAAELLEAIADRFEKLKKGSRIISAKEIKSRDSIEMIASIQVKFSYGV